MPSQERRFFAKRSLPKRKAMPIEAIVQEYVLLSLNTAPSEIVANRIDEILTLAIADSALNDCLSAIDEAIGQQQGLLDEDRRNKYGNALAHLREFIVIDSLESRETGNIWQNEAQRLRDRIDLLYP